MRRTSPFNIVSVALGLAFLYLPIVILVIYSFNASRLVTVWGGWSLTWYRALLHDDAMLQAAWTSLRIAALSASVATVLGTLAAVALIRMGRFRGRLLFSGMVYAPLVMPEVITGLSLLLLFVAFNVDRGFWTVAIAHTTLTLCFVAVIVQSRLISFDRSLGVRYVAGADEAGRGCHELLTAHCEERLRIPVHRTDERAIAHLGQRGAQVVDVRRLVGADEPDQVGGLVGRVGNFGIGQNLLGPGERRRAPSQA
jgi:signal transduction histidine kinase